MTGTRGFGVKNRSDPLLKPPFFLINSNFLVFANFSKFGVRFSKQKLTGSTASFFTNSFALSSAQAQPSSGSVQLKCSREFWRALGSYCKLWSKLVLILSRISVALIWNPQIPDLVFGPWPDHSHASISSSISSPLVWTWTFARVGLIMRKKIECENA